LEQGRFNDFIVAERHATVDDHYYQPLKTTMSVNQINLVLQTACIVPKGRIE